MSEQNPTQIAASEVANVRDFERFLHAAGFTKSRAKALASRGWVETAEETRGITLAEAQQMLAQAEE